MAMNVLDALAPTQVHRAQKPRVQSKGTPEFHKDFNQALDDLFSSQRGETDKPAPSPLRFSRHAESRLSSRGITLDENQLTRLSEAVDKLDKRGAKESLVMLDDHAFIVGVPKRTVITAMTRTEAVGHLFTQIDSTLFVP
jgi:flagellar operon protein